MPVKAKDKASDGEGKGLKKADASGLKKADYLLEIDAYDRKMGNWETRGRQIVKRYRVERERARRSEPNSRFNLFWSNVETILPTLYFKTPKVEVEQRLKHRDIVARDAAELLERTATYNLGEQEFDENIEQAVKDLLLVGRGQSWVRYEKGDGEELQDPQAANPQTESVKDIAYECAPCDYIAWEDFGHNVARYWREVWLGWRIHYLTREECKKHFGEKGADIPLDYTPEQYREAKKQAGDSAQRAQIYELWNKRDKVVVWLHRDRGIVKQETDPLGLKRFFPFPRPLYATTTNETLEPVPDYIESEDLYLQIDELNARATEIENAILVRMAYDSSQPDLAKLIDPRADMKAVPVGNWAAFQQGGGIKGGIDFMPLEELVKALQVIYEGLDRKKAKLDEQTGIADIVRGATQASETATAQQLKSNYVSVRSSKRQRQVQRFVRDIIDIQAEIIAEHFQPQTMIAATGLMLQTPEEAQAFTMAFELLRTDLHRRFKIAIETDSTIAISQQQEQEQRVQLIQATSQYLQQFIQIAQMMPPLAPAAAEILMFAVRSFRGSRQIEDSLEQATDQIMQMVQQQAAQAAAPQEQQQDPRVVQGQMQMQLDQQKQESDVQMQQQKLVMEQQKEQMRAEAEARRLASEQKIKELQLAVEHEKLLLERDKLNMQGALDLRKLSIEQTRPATGPSPQPAPRNGGPRQ